MGSQVVASSACSAWLQAGGLVSGKLQRHNERTAKQCEGVSSGNPGFGRNEAGRQSCSSLGRGTAAASLARSTFAGRQLSGKRDPFCLRVRQSCIVRRGVECQLFDGNDNASKQAGLQNAPSPAETLPPADDILPGDSPADSATPARFSSRRAFLASGAMLLTAAIWQTNAESATPTPPPPRMSTPQERKERRLEAEAAAAKASPRPDSRVYDSSVLGEPLSLNSKERVWEKLTASRVVYLGTTERVPVAEDQEVILEITSKLRDLCFKEKRPVTLALQAFPRTLQEPLNWWMGNRLTESQLRAYVFYWPDEMFQRYLPLLKYCRDYGVRLYATGVPSQVLRTVLLDGVEGLSPEEQRLYAPPKRREGLFALDTSAVQVAGDMPGPPSASITLERTYFRFAQARSVVDYSMALAIADGIAAQGNRGVLIAVMGASHTAYGARGKGVPGRLAGKLKRQGQTVVQLNPEEQYKRKEGDVPVADFLWYSGSSVCTHNCFDRVEVARVMDAAGRVREALPSDIQAGLDQGLIPPDVLKEFFELQTSPVMAFFTERFQGLRERW